MNKIMYILILICILMKINSDYIYTLILCVYIDRNLMCVADL